MARHLGFDWHFSAETLEEYAFNRLSEAATEALEEHLLLCTLCQNKLKAVDEYILLMKHVSAQRELERTSIGRRWWWGALVGGSTAMAVLVMAVLMESRRVEPTAALEQVELAAFRGDEEMAHSGAGHPINVVIDASDLSGSSRYRVEVVNTSGRMVWRGPTIAAEGRLSALISARLKRGIYWVRLSTLEGELVREYGLRAD